jgi:hypothetical protein
MKSIKKDLNRNKKIINVKNKGVDLKKNTDHNRVRELQYYLAV